MNKISCLFFFQERKQFQVVLLFEINPFVRTNGTFLAETILIPSAESVNKFYKNANRFDDIWTTNYNNIFSRYEVNSYLFIRLFFCCFCILQRNKSLMLKICIKKKKSMTIPIIGYDAGC